jgi:hypothetical protein
MKTTLLNAWLFVKKHWRWLLPAVVFALFVMVPDKSFLEILGFIAGAIFMGFTWYAWTHYLKGKI